MALLPQVKALVALHAHRQVSGRLDGEYAAASQVGRSMNFNDLRDYVRGDDVKDIDWKASARTRSLLVKRFEAVRNHTIMLVVSSGRSMAAHLDETTTKRDVAVFAAGVVGMIALRHGDRVGLAHGTAAGQHLVPPGAGELHLERCLQSVHTATTTRAPASDLAGLLEHVARSTRRRTLMLVVCDDDEVGDRLLDALRRLVVQHDVLLLSIADLDPTGLPRGRQVADVDTGRALPDWVLADPVLAAEHAADLADRRRSMAQQLDSVGVVHERVHDEPGALVAVFRLLERHRRVGRA